MRFMVIVKATKSSEAGVLPSEELLTAMGKYNEELTKAGVMLAGEGLHPSSKGARVRFEGEKRTVIDGPFAEQRSWLPASGYGSARRNGRRSNRSSAVPILCPKNPRSRFGRCSRPMTLAPPSRLDSASKRKDSAPSLSKGKARNHAKSAMKLPFTGGYAALGLMDPALPKFEKYKTE